MESYIPPSVIKFDGLSFDEGDYKYDEKTGAIDYTNVDKPSKN
ncbi:hypothetical protein [Mycoplasmopsis cynos]|nr:hypothetical protein [Mycoplasmopsis cynos]WAM07653.1 hypothetical protein ONA21_06030 [Mycoplasmopsis cynos]